MNNIFNNNTASHIKLTALLFWILSSVAGSISHNDQLVDYQGQQVSLLSTSKQEASEEKINKRNCEKKVTFYIKKSNGELVECKADLYDPTIYAPDVTWLYDKNSEKERAYKNRIMRLGVPKVYNHWNQVGTNIRSEQVPSVGLLVL